MHPNTDCVHLLLRAHVDRSIRTLDGKTAAAVAEQAGNPEVFALLV